MRLHAMTGHAAMADGGGSADAATLARLQADRAQERAQKLAALADATASLRQGLNADQRLVFDEAARHFAREHGHGGMEALAEGGHHGMMGDHCERAGGHGEDHGGYSHSRGHAQSGEDTPGSTMAPQDRTPAPSTPDGAAVH